jgi:hypothetical protein
MKAMNAKRTLVLLPLLLTTVLCLFDVSCVATVRGGGVGLWVDIPPPALREEVVIERPGPDHVWVGGFWEWRPAVHNYEWVPGHWARPPHRRAVWVGPRWEHRRRGWYYRPGYWR